MQGKPCCDGTCQGNGVQLPDSPVSARILFGLADEISARADACREIYRHASHGDVYDEICGLLLRAGQMCAEHRLEVKDLDLVGLKPAKTEPDKTTDARWLADQANEYAKQQGRQEQEAANLLRAASFLCAARGASLEDLHVVVERGM